MSLLPVISSSLARWLRAQGERDRAAVFERVNSTQLDSDAFRASDSIGLDGAPSMVFVDTMPTYSPAIDRPSARHGVTADQREGETR
jgi:hypothetical protein